MLGLELHLQPDALQFYDPAAGGWLQTPEEAAEARTEQAEARAEAAEAEAAHLRAELDRLRGNP